MAEILQKGTEVSADETNRRWAGKTPPSLVRLSGMKSAARAAQDLAPSRRDQKMADLEKEAVGYAKGGRVANKLTMNAFEQSRFDKDSRSAPEGSAADMARDKKQMGAENRKRGFAKGGLVCDPGPSPLNTPRTDAAGSSLGVKRGYGAARGGGRGT